MLLLEPQMALILEFEASADYSLAQKAPQCGNMSQSFDVQMPRSCLAPNPEHFPISSKDLCNRHDGHVGFWQR